MTAHNTASVVTYKLLAALDTVSRAIARRDKAASKRDTGHAQTLQQTRAVEARSAGTKRLRELKARGIAAAYRRGDLALRGVQAFTAAYAGSGYRFNSEFVPREAELCEVKLSYEMKPRNAGGMPLLKAIEALNSLPDYRPGFRKVPKRPAATVVLERKQLRPAEEDPRLERLRQQRHAEAQPSEAMRLYLAAFPERRARPASSLLRQSSAQTSEEGPRLELLRQQLSRPPEPRRRRPRN